MRPFHLVAVMVMVSSLSCRTNNPIAGGSEVSGANDAQKPVRIQAGFLLKKVAALAYLPKGKPTAALIVNPGAYVPVNAMADLATAGAEAGFVVYIIDNFQNLAILPTNQDNVLKLARFLHNQPEVFTDLPEAVVDAHKAGIPVIGMGHSMGGAVLGQYAGTSDTGLDKMVLLGVSSLVKTPAKAMIPLTFAYGTHDTVTNPEAAAILAKKLGASTLPIPEVNHFCVISDSKIGDPSYKNRDSATSLSGKQCGSAVISILVENHIL